MRETRMYQSQASGLWAVELKENNQVVQILYYDPLDHTQKSHIKTAVDCFLDDDYSNASSVFDDEDDNA